MDYEFYTNDFDRIKNHKETYPLAGKIFDYPTSFWFGVRKAKHKAQHLYSRIPRLLHRASPGVPVMVLYNLPDRDMGQHSKGGARDREDYLHYVNVFARCIGDAAPIVIFEPDALPHSTLMEPDQRTERLDMMREALKIITTKSNAIVYVDIGHSNWLPPETAGELFNKVFVNAVRGFSVNVSNFRATTESMDWALRVGDYTMTSHFVIDTSRNGNGPYGNDWCNPPGRALGKPATVDTGNELCDAFLWIKVPGESDGRCNNGPRAGRFWLDYARELVSNTDWIS